ncbi:unnamed protein product (macronuclear) [Paramecium tetraurelia]|uniref:Protein kinase domain-containing protein n=1 Tax=Paramecium tetraurelia TaxID=5888 RepID=A0CD19_PARTE|nr:uncharacterized protein GSPATT00037471001 [Paramecium tetraurelia]CAK68686.1 unnamed protein product [Paramecium tetraurelia]|eukprot:XP_001436083.1 hypothetical protein (macronuclear) [Paramecium tetraurelia strain d4-2]
MLQGEDVDFLQEMYQIKEIAKIGEGSFGKVYKATDLTDNTECAVKVVSKTLFKDAQIESDIYQQLNHPHIVQCKRITENKNQFFLIMELMKGGTLAQRMNQEYTDEDFAIIMKGILLAVHYLHEKRIIHRDLKPENIMFATTDIRTVKIADFGLSFKFASEGMFYSLLNKKCGTVIYMAPEQFKEKFYSKQVDSWSCGVIMYMLLNSGQHPFYNKNDTRDQVIKKIMNPIWQLSDHMSPLAKDLIQKLTTIEPIERYSVGQALIHPWITRNFSDKIPLTYNEQISQFIKDQQIRNSFKLLLFLQYLMKNCPIQQPYPNDEILLKLTDKKKLLQQYQSLPNPKSQKQKMVSNIQKIKNMRSKSPKDQKSKQNSKSKPKTSFDNLNTLEDQKYTIASFKKCFQQKASVRPKTIDEILNDNSAKSRQIVRQKLELPPLKRK